MSISFLSDVVKILSKGHLRLSQRVALLNSFVHIKLLRRKGEHNPDTPITVLSFKVYTDNIGDFYATFYEIFINEEYASKSMQQAKKIFDVGANIGLATLYFKWRNPGCEIVGFEMDDDTYRFYEKNVTENSLQQVVTHKCGIGGQEATMTTHGSRRATTLYKDRAEQLPDRAEPSRKKTVTVKKLSPFIDGIDLALKMDIEGAETDVITELAESDTLRSFNYMIFEFHYPMGTEYSELENTLKAAGFTVEKSPQQKNGYFMVEASR